MGEVVLVDREGRVPRECGRSCLGSNKFHSEDRVGNPFCEIYKLRVKPTIFTKNKKIL